MPEKSSSGKRNKKNKTAADKVPGKRKKNSPKTNVKGVKGKAVIPGKEIKALQKDLDKHKKVAAQKDHRLEEFKEKYYNFFDLSPSFFMILDIRGRIVEANLSASEFLGIPEKKLQGTFFIRYLESDMKKFVALLRECRVKYDQMTDEFILRSADQRNKHILLSAVPFYEPSNRQLHFRIFFSDITLRKHYEESLKESESRFRLLADSSPATIWILDINGRIEYANKTMLQFFGVDILWTEKWYSMVHPDDREKFQTELLSATKAQKSFSNEIRFMNRNGEYRWILNTIAPIFQQNGTFTGLIATGVDITNEKKLRINLEKSMREKDLLLREIHHRVKNNLQLVSSLLNMQSEFVKFPEQLSAITSIQNRIRSMAFLHEELYESQDIQGVNSRDYLNEIIFRLFETYKKTSDIKLHLNLPEMNLGINISMVLGLIVNELVSNSLKHAFEKKTTGNIAVDMRVDGHNLLVLTVKDDGDGLPEGFNDEDNRSFGLVLVNSLVEQYNGSMEIHQNGGTEFKLNLSYTDEDVIKN